MHEPRAGDHLTAGALGLPAGDGKFLDFSPDLVHTLLATLVAQKPLIHYCVAGQTAFRGACSEDQRKAASSRREGVFGEGLYADILYAGLKP